MKRYKVGAGVLAGFLTVTGALHYVSPGFFDEIVPRALPGSARLWTYLSGAAELSVAAALAVPRTRKLGGYAAAALFLAVFPANVQMAIDWGDRPLSERLVAYGRLPLQIPLIIWALWAARSAPAAQQPKN